MDTILHGDACTILKTVPDASVQMCCTSPPYYALRDYGVEGQIGLEATPYEYIAKLVEVFREVKRVLRPDGTLWVNIGDTYSNDTKSGGHSSGKHQKELHAVTRPRRYTGLPSKNLIGIPWRLAFALQDDGWILRSDIIWSKINGLPESVQDRPTRSHEYVFLLAKSDRYYYNADAIREPCVTKSNLRDRAKDGKWADGALLTPLGKGTREWNHPLGRNKRSVWSIAGEPFPGSHFAVMPQKLVEPCVLAGSRPGDVVLDPFCGVATVPLVALSHNRRAIGIEIKADYVELARKRIAVVQPMLWTTRRERL